MYCQHLGLKKPPFAEEPDPDIFFPDADRAKVLRAVYADLQRKQAAVRLIGAEGTGKTIICRLLVQLLPDKFKAVYLGSPGGSFDELLQALRRELGAEPAQDADLHALLEQHVREERKVLLIVDSAEQMFPAALERLIRTVAAANGLFQAILAGRPALSDRLDQLNAYCADISVPAGHVLAPLTEAETAAYLSFRLKEVGMPPRKEPLFSDRAARKIFEQAGGSLRTVNLLADKALQQAFADKKSFPVLPAHVVELHAEPPQKAGAASAAGKRLLPVILASVVLIGLPVLFFLYSDAFRSKAQELFKDIAHPLPKPQRIVPVQAPPELKPEQEEEPAAPMTQAVDAEPEQPAATPPAASVEQANQATPSATQETQPTASAPPEPKPEQEEGLAAPTTQAVDAEAEQPAAPPTASAEQANQTAPSATQETPPPASDSPAPTEPKPAVPEQAAAQEKPADEQKAEDAQAVPAISPTAAQPEKIIIITPKMRKTRPKPKPELKAEPPKQAVQQSAAEQEHPAPEAQRQAEEPEQAEAAAPSAAPAADAPNADQLYRELLAAGSQLRSRAAANKYTIHLLMLSGERAAAQLKEMIVRDEYLEYKNQLQILKSPSGLLVLYGTYNSMDEAREARNNMPLFLRKHHPYALPVDSAVSRAVE